MKNIVRAFVVVLVLTGAAASTHTTTPATVKTIAAPVKSSLMPIPQCGPDNGCVLK
jgi:hypothetical protein